MREKMLRENIATIIRNQKYAVLATQDLNKLYTNLIAFFSSNDLKNIYFVTSKISKKYFNLINNPNVSVLIDNRKNDSSDLKKATAITATGKAAEIKDNLSNIKNLYIKKHPELNKFIESYDSVFINVKVNNYIYVNKFQNKNVLIL